VEWAVTFEEFYRSARPELLRALTFTVEERDLAINVADEALARACEQWAVVCRMANPTGWAFRVAVNLARNRFRRRSLERRRPRR